MNLYYLTTLNSTDKKLIEKALVSNLKKSKLSNVFASKARTVSNDNPDIYATSRSWTWADSAELKSKADLINFENQQINKLKMLSKAEIKENKFNYLRESLVSAKPYYVLEKLQGAIKKESQIQPDGTFTLKSGEDFYLIEVDSADKRRPKAIKFALIRMQQHKDKPQVELSTDAFFAFKELPSISL